MSKNTLPLSNVSTKAHYCISADELENLLAMAHLAHLAIAVATNSNPNTTQPTIAELSQRLKEHKPLHDITHNKVQKWKQTQLAQPNPSNGGLFGGQDFTAKPKQYYPIDADR